MVWDAPRAGVEIQSVIERAVLHRAAQLGVAVAAAQGPGASAGPRVVFQQLDLVAGAAQFHGGHHARHARAQDQHAGATRVAVQLEGAGVAAFRGMPSAVIAVYRAEPPAAAPIRASKSRRVRMPDA